MREFQQYQRFSSHPDPLRPTQTSGDRASRGANLRRHRPPYRVLDLSTTDACPTDAPSPKPNIGAHRWLALTEEINAVTSDLDELVHLATPGLTAQLGVSGDVAAKLLIAAGDSPEWIRTEAGFAALRGLGPVSASSGRTTRHRLNRSGDRQANNALWTIARVRLTSTPPPAPTPNAAPKKDSHTAISSAASSAISPADCSPSSSPTSPN